MIVCIEGPTGAGKSTLAKKLSEDWEVGFSLCPTVDNFLDGFPMCGFGAEGIEANFISFLRGEVKAVRFMTERGGNWVQDRNWVSQITFLMAIEQTCGIRVTELMQRLLESLDRSELLLPETFVYISCSPELTVIRRAHRGTTPWGDVPPWIVRKRWAAFRKARFWAYERIFPDVLSNVIMLNAVDLEGHSKVPIELRELRNANILKKGAFERLKVLLGG